MEIIMRKAKELKPYAANAKKHDEKQIANVANSIRRFGWQQPIVIDEHDVVVIGHCRLLAAKRLGLDEVPVTVASGLTDEEIRELRIADNKTNESPWDEDMLRIDASGLTFDGFDFDLGINVEETIESKYTSAVNLPQYEITGETPEVQTLYDDAKCRSLIMAIDGSGLSETEKAFLRIAAYRHVVFDYTKIAEFYAQASAECQKLMEQSALVIIDVENAIANGYVMMCDTIDQLCGEDTDA